MILAYHFVGRSLRDERPVPPDGEWLEHKAPLIMCESGLHASEHPFDALSYAPGQTLCLVELDGEYIRDADKIVASRRRILRRLDAAPLLHEFARWCALQVIHLWDAPPVVREYLETGREDIVAATAAAARAAAEAATATRAAGAAVAARAAQREKFKQMVEQAFGAATNTERTKGRR